MAGADATGASSGGGTVSVGAGWGTGAPGSGAPSSGGVPVGNGGAGGRWACTSTYLALNNEGGMPAGGPLPGAWYSVTCTDGATGVQVTRTSWITSVGPAPATPGVDPSVLALQAERSMTLPTPSIRTNPAGTSVVNLDTWLWIDPALWHAVSVTAVAGPVAATAVATPVAVIWSTGDGATVRCDGPGEAFPAVQATTASAPGCSHRYRRTSIGQWSPDGSADGAVYRLRAVVQWAVRWTSQGVAGGGPLPGLETSAWVPLRVEQVESIGILAGSPVAAARSWPR